MTPHSLADVLTLWRALLAVPQARWHSTAAARVAACARARAHRAATGQVHPFLGDGSLSSLCLRAPCAPVPAALDARALAALRVAADALGKARGE